VSKLAEELRARAARQASRSRDAEPAEPSEQPSPPARGKSTPRTDTVRITVDLAPLLHRMLKRWCSAAADDLDLAAVPAAVVIRTLLQELQADPELAERIRERLPQELDRQ
jgi:hypothetical protein